MEKENKKKPFHLTVTDNETGETVQDLDFDALIGAAHIGEMEAGGIIVSRCSTMTLAATSIAVEQTLNKLCKDDPLVAFAKCGIDSTMVENEPEETENNQ